MLLDALLVILSGLACFGVAAIELHEPVRRTMDGDPRSGSRRLPGTWLAGVVAAPLAILAWWAAGRLPGNGAILGTATAMLLYGLWRLTGGILSSSAPPPGDAAPAAAADPFARLVARWLAVALVAVTSGLATAQPEAAALGAIAALAAVGGLSTGILSALMERVPAGVAMLLVALLVTALGTLWAGAAVGIAWPGGGVAILALVVGYLIVAVGALEVSRQWLRAARPLPGDPVGAADARAERPSGNGPVGER